MNTRGDRVSARLSSGPGNVRSSRYHSKDSATGFSLAMCARGLLESIGIALVLAFLASVVVYVSSFDERVMNWVVNAGSFLAVGVASFVTARRAESHGLAYGLAVGSSYALVTLLLGTVFFPPFVGITVAAKRLGFCMLAGACCGVLGVNS